MKDYNMTVITFVFVGDTDCTVNCSAACVSLMHIFDVRRQNHQMADYDCEQFLHY